MCWSCLKKLVKERAERKRSRDFAKEQQSKSPQSETSTESKTSET